MVYWRALFEGYELKTKSAARIRSESKSKRGGHPRIDKTSDIAICVGQIHQCNQRRNNRDGTGMTTVDELDRTMRSKSFRPSYSRLFSPFRCPQAVVLYGHDEISDLPSANTAKASASAALSTIALATLVMTVIGYYLSIQPRHRIGDPENFNLEIVHECQQGQRSAKNEF